jgi:uncharacterized protein YbjT (DUF2867 family)
MPLHYLQEVMTDRQRKELRGGTAMNDHRHNSQIKILVTAAGGFLGSHLVRALKSSGYDVVCSGRNTDQLRARFPDCTVIKADFTQDQKVEDWLPRLTGVAVVINAAGIFRERGFNTFTAVHRDGPIALFRAAEQMGVRRVIQISALGADAGATTAYHLTKKAADETLATLSVEWIIVQPSIIYGDGAKSLAFLTALAALPVIPLVGKGNQLLQPVSITDVTTAVLHLVRSADVTRTTLAAVGADSATLCTILKTLRRWLGLQPTVTLRIPLGLVSTIAKLGQVLRWQFVHPAAVSMLCRGNVADPSPFARVLKRAPLTFTHAFQECQSQAADRRQASLYFLRSVLRLSIASVWLIAGVISLWVYPREASESLLVRSGIPAEMAPYVLNLLAGTDIGLGLGTWMKWHLPFIAIIQLCLIVGFSLVIAVSLPEFVIHPFGAVVKNMPLFAATLVMLALEQER